MAIATFEHESDDGTSQADKYNHKDNEKGTGAIGEKILQDIADWKSDYNK